MSRVREVERLGEVGYGEERENEREIVMRGMGLPENYMGLSYEEQSMVMLYVDGEIVEPVSERRTKGDILASYLMTFPNKKLLEKIFVTENVMVGTDASGQPVMERRKVIDPEMYPQYLRLKANATAMWRKNNLKDLVHVVREMVEYGGFKDEDLLERAIVDDAMSKDKSNYTARMRQMAIKIKGMEKNNQLQQVNVYMDSGGKELNKRLAESSGNNNYDLGIIEGEIDVTEK